MEQKIKDDELRVELNHEKEGDLEYKIAFDKSFYGKRSVSVVKEDAFKIREEMC